MKDVKDSDLIGMGMDLAVYIFAKLIDEGVSMTPQAWKILGEHCSKQIQEKTGMPIEDLALGVQPVIADMLEKIK